MDISYCESRVQLQRWFNTAGGAAATFNTYDTPCCIQTLDVVQLLLCRSSPFKDLYSAVQQPATSSRKEKKQK
eukprot:scaffold26631_cov139-Skeletonema_menzelii.AAC.5